MRSSALLTSSLSSEPDSPFILGATSSRTSSRTLRFVASHASPPRARAALPPDLRFVPPDDEEADAESAPSPLLGAQAQLLESSSCLLLLRALAAEATALFAVRHLRPGPVIPRKEKGADSASASSSSGARSAGRRQRGARSWR